MNDELSAWERSREATRRIMADIGCDEKGWPIEKPRSFVDRIAMMLNPENWEDGNYIGPDLNIEPESWTVR